MSCVFGGGCRKATSKKDNHEDLLLQHTNNFTAAALDLPKEVIVGRKPFAHVVQKSKKSNDSGSDRTDPLDPDFDDFADFTRERSSKHKHKQNHHRRPIENAPTRTPDATHTIPPNYPPFSHARKNHLPLQQRQRHRPPSPVPEQLPDHLSDLPSNVDQHTRGRYLQACRLLKTALVESGQGTIHQTDRVVLDRLLLGGGAHGGSDQTTPPSELVKLRQLESFLADESSTVTTTPSRLSKQRYTTVVTPQEATIRPFSKATTTRTTTPSEIYPDPPLELPLGHSSSSLFSDITDHRPLQGRTFLELRAIEESRAVLRPPLLEGLRGFFPGPSVNYVPTCEFSVERDGPSLETMLACIEHSRYTLFGIRTVDGSVFGAFCSSPWKVGPCWFGCGESFLWRLKQKKNPGRAVEATSEDYLLHHQDNEIEIYPYTGSDTMIQFCTTKTIAFGGASNWATVPGGCPYPEEPWGTGLLLYGNLLGGESNCSVTFANPRLCGDRSSNEFQMDALEVWSLSPPQPDGSWHKPPDESSGTNLSFSDEMRKRIFQGCAVGCTRKQDSM